MFSNNCNGEKMSTQKLLSLCISVVLTFAAALNAADVRPGAKAGEKMTLTVNGIDYTFCWCPPGEFVMGSPASETDRDKEEHQHRGTSCETSSADFPELRR